MFAADAGKLWVLNEVERTYRWMERYVEWGSARVEACSGDQVDIFTGGCEGTGRVGRRCRPGRSHTGARAWWADAV